jgi:hypothetical protein
VAAPGEASRVDPTRLTLPIFVERSRSDGDADDAEYVCSVCVAGSGDRKRAVAVVPPRAAAAFAAAASSPQPPPPPPAKPRDDAERAWARAVSDHASLWRIFVSARL